MKKISEEFVWISMHPKLASEIVIILTHAEVEVHTPVVREGMKMVRTVVEQAIANFIRGES